MPDTAAPAWFEEGGAAPLPDWFDPAVHHAGTGGIFETATGVLLADDGLPVSAPLRAEREAMAASAQSAEAASGRRAPPPAASAPAAVPQE